MLILYQVKNKVQGIPVPSPVVRTQRFLCEDLGSIQVQSKSGQGTKIPHKLRGLPQTPSPNFSE